MEDFYQVLGIPRGASAQLVRIAFEGKMKALDDPRFPLTPEARRAEELLLKNAHVTLTVDAKRAVYDEKLDAFLANPKAGKAGMPRLRNSHFAFISILVAVVVLGIGAQLVERSRERDRLKLEQERLAVERDRMAKQLELDEERFKDAQARKDYADEQTRQRNEQYRVSRERADYDRWRNATDAQSRYSDRQSSAAEMRSAYEQRYAEERARQQEYQERMAAQREVERQKQYLRQKEYDEERARVERHNRVQMEEYQRKMQKAQEDAMARQPR